MAHPAYAGLQAVRTGLAPPPPGGAAVKAAEKRRTPAVAAPSQALPLHPGALPGTPLSGAPPWEGSTPTTVATTSPLHECEAEDAASDGASSYEPHRFSVEETVLIFDWDDTVLPSTWVLEQGWRADHNVDLRNDHHEQLDALARHVVETLEIAKGLGTVVLVTNAEQGWIELSCRRFLPSLYPVLEGIKVMSARTEYETLEHSSPFEWKLRAFGSEIGRIFAHDPRGRRRKNILSMGDSAHEREAVLRTTACIPNCRTKSLKFMERPGIDQLCRQHQFMARCLGHIVHHDGNLDLCIGAA